MVFSIFVMLTQVGLEAYILGTLFHYVVKKDAKLEEFRCAASQPCCILAMLYKYCLLFGSMAAYAVCSTMHGL